MTDPLTTEQIADAVRKAFGVYMASHDPPIKGIVADLTDIAAKEASAIVALALLEAARELAAAQARIAEFKAASKAGQELAEYASYAEIVGGIRINRSEIRKWCDEVFVHVRANSEREFAEEIAADAARLLNQGSEGAATIPELPAPETQTP